MGLLDEALLGRAIGQSHDIMSITDCVAVPDTVDDVSELITYAGCMQNNGDATVEAQLDFLLQVGTPRPVMAQSPTVVVDPGEIWCPPEVTRRLDDPVADENNVIQNVVADGGVFEVTAVVVNVVEV